MCFQFSHVRIKGFATIQVKEYPGADCGSAHISIVATMKVIIETLQMR